MLRDIRIKNYRCFQEFHIDGLARVNLLVGSNNIGKTSLLEALYLLVNQENPQSLLEILHNRGEVAEQFISGVPGEMSRISTAYPVKHIFHSHQLKPNQTIHLQSEKEFPLSLQIQLNSVTHPDPLKVSALSLSFSYGDNEGKQILLRDDGAIETQYFRFPKEFKPYLLLSNNKILDFDKMATICSNITLTSKEDKVVEALQIIEPDVERIGFTIRQPYNFGILLKKSGDSHPLPLSSMGEGMRRIFTLVMAAVTAENGFLLVDEIDTGLHYEIQTDMWRLIIQIAQQLNVQVFATTHSWDCICALQEALEELEDNSVVKLFRLSRKYGKLRPVEYTADDLDIAVRQSIEVR
ncbi:MAG: ATP/GTP-binding protein [Xenococcaceae cyanobacterium]